MRSTDTPLAAAVTTLAVAHSKMGVGKKLRRILSFKKKKEDKPAIEAPKVEKSTTLNGTKGKSSSLISLGRKFSFGSRDKTKKDKTKKGTAPVPESSAPQANAVPEDVTIAPQANAVPEDVTIAPKAAGEVATVETLDQQIKPAVVPVVTGAAEVVSDEIAADRVNENGESLFEKMEPQKEQEDIKDENACGDGIELSAGQVAPFSEEQSDKPDAMSVESEKNSELLSAMPSDEPKTITEVINKIHDKSETNQTGNEFVRIVEVEQERTLAEDGTTVISRSTKTTTTTVDRDGPGSVSQVKTEIKKEVLPRVSNGQSRQISQLAPKNGSASLQLVFAFITVALACAVLYKLEYFRALSLA